MRISSLLLISALAGGCASDGSAACPDPDDPVAAELQCHLVQFLHAEGLGDDQIIVDASMLLGTEGRASVASRPGWTSVSTGGSDVVDAIFELGEPGIYRSGQRVVYFNNKVSLATFAVNIADDAFISTIEVGIDGTVLANGTDAVPH